MILMFGCIGKDFWIDSFGFSGSSNWNNFHLGVVGKCILGIGGLQGERRRSCRGQHFCIR